jgi:sortase A
MSETLYTNPDRGFFSSDLEPYPGLLRPGSGAGRDCDLHYALDRPAPDSCALGHPGLNSLPDRPRLRPVLLGLRRPRRAWRVISWVLIVFGCLVLADAGVTLVWQEPLSALYARIQQDELSGTLHGLERAAPTPIERRQLAHLPSEAGRIAFLARELQRHAGAGSPVGSIHIPHIHAAYVVVKGTGTSELEKGPGVYPETRFPGIPGTTAIAGHRTTYLAPFRHIDALGPGDQILLDMPYAHFTYTVVGSRVVLPSDVAAAVDPVGYSRLVLSACTPLFSAEKRLLVYARLTSVTPEGAARVGLTSGARTLPGGALGRPPVALPLAQGATVQPAPTSPQLRAPASPAESAPPT